MEWKIILGGWVLLRSFAGAAGLAMLAWGAAQPARGEPRDCGSGALVVDIGGTAHSGNGNGGDAEARVPFVESGEANPKTAIFRIDFRADVDAAARKRGRGYEHPLVILAPSAALGELAVGSLKEHGFTRVCLGRVS